MGRAETDPNPSVLLIVVGPSSHPPGTHEVAASARLLQHCLDQAGVAHAFSTVIAEGWPADPALLAKTRVVIFTGDQFPPYRFENSDTVFAQLGRMMDRGCGIICLHYATSVNDTKTTPVPSAVQQSLSRWLGGFGHFLPGNVLPGAQARVMDVTISPTRTGHPVGRGVRPFSLRDEPYFKLSFDAAGSGNAVTPLATSLLPPEAPHEEVVAWSVERRDGGRGVGVVMPHFFANWQNDDLRKLVLNGILWAAGAEIPVEGIESRLPPRETFRPLGVGNH